MEKHERCVNQMVLLPLNKLYGIWKSKILWTKKKTFAYNIFMDFWRHKLQNYKYMYNQSKNNTNNNHRK